MRFYRLKTIYGGLALLLIFGLSANEINMEKCEKSMANIMKESNKMFSFSGSKNIVLKNDDKNMMESARNKVEVSSFDGTQKAVLKKNSGDKINKVIYEKEKSNGEKKKYVLNLDLSDSSQGCKVSSVNIEKRNLEGEVLEKTKEPLTSSVCQKSFEEYEDKNFADLKEKINKIEEEVKSFNNTHRDKGSLQLSANLLGENFEDCSNIFENPFLIKDERPYPSYENLPYRDSEESAGGQSR